MQSAHTFFSDSPLGLLISPTYFRPNFMSIAGGAFAKDQFTLALCCRAVGSEHENDSGKGFADRLGRFLINYKCLAVLNGVLRACVKPWGDADEFTYQGREFV